MSENLNAHSEVEISQNSPVVISPYGFKIQEYDGKKYYFPMSKEEYIEALTDDPEIPEEFRSDLIQGVKEDKRSCYTITTMQCGTRNNCQWCSFTKSKDKFYCYCMTWPTKSQ